MILNDNSPMPFGKYKGVKMANVPASYLLWLYDNDKCTQEIRDYVNDNIDALELEMKLKEYEY